jgi:hypothetical protein
VAARCRNPHDEGVLEDSWSPTAADAFRRQTALARIEAAAQGCGIAAGRWHRPPYPDGVVVRLGEHRAVVYPGVDPTDWVVADVDGVDLRLEAATTLSPVAGEHGVPTRAWSRLLLERLTTEQPSS